MFKKCPRRMVMLLKDVRVGYIDTCLLRKGMKFKLVEKGKSTRRALLQVFPNRYGEYVCGWRCADKEDNRRFWWVDDDVISYQKLEI